MSDYFDEHNADDAVAVARNREQIEYRSVAGGHCSSNPTNPFSIASGLIQRDWLGHDDAAGLLGVDRSSCAPTCTLA